MRTILILLFAATICAADDPNHEQVKFVLGNVSHVVSGDILVEAQDGGILLEARNQTIWSQQKLPQK